MVVRRDRRGLDTGAHQVVHQHRLDLRLTALEVVTSDERVVLLRQLEHARHEGVLGRTVDVRVALQNGSHGEDRRRRHLRRNKNRQHFV